MSTHPSMTHIPNQPGGCWTPEMFRALVDSIWTIDGQSWLNQHGLRIPACNIPQKLFGCGFWPN